MLGKACFWCVGLNKQNLEHYNTKFELHPHLLKTLLFTPHLAISLQNIYIEAILFYRIIKIHKHIVNTFH